MADSMPHSELKVDAVGPVTWTRAGGVLERRVVVRIEGLLVMHLDGARRFAKELQDAITAASEVE